MLYKKCTGCKHEFTKEDLEEKLSKLKRSKVKLKKNACPDCRSAALKTYDESRFQKKWYGYLNNNDERMIDHLILVEFHYYDDDSFEVKIPLLSLVLETRDFYEAINMPDEKIASYLKETYKIKYGSEHKFLTQACADETITVKQDVAAWWQ